MRRSLHIALMLAAAPTLIGVIRWMQARLVGRAGPPILQPWQDLARLLRKQPVMAESASEVSAIAPLLSARRGRDRGGDGALVHTWA